MKAKIIITPKKAVLDPQGKTVQNALEHMGYQGIVAVRVGKYLEIELAGSDQETARELLAGRPAHGVDRSAGSDGQGVMGHAGYAGHPQR